jgi:hypothetical protein
MSSVTMGPGYRALDELLAVHYGGQEYAWFTPYQETIEATRGLFAGIRIYRKDNDTSVPHWHFVTFGLSELGETDSPGRAQSGFGFELTCRVPWNVISGPFGTSAEPPAEPPMWPLTLLAHLARYVFACQTFLAEGHHVDLQGPVDGKGPLTAVVLAADPILKSAVTPNGRVDFLQTVGLCGDELAALKSWRFGPFLELMCARDPLLLTDPTRPSLLADPTVAERVREGIERDGSSLAVTVGERVAWLRGLGSEPRVDLTLDAKTAQEVRNAIPRMLRKGRPFVCQGKPDLRNSTVIFVPAEESRWSVNENGSLVVEMAGELIDSLEANLSAPAILEWPSPLHFKLRVLAPPAP